MAKADPDPPVVCTNVSNAAGLDNIRNELNSGHLYCLTRDIDLASISNFVPIGTADMPFRGSFDGRGHAIRNLTMNSDVESVGLFGTVEGRIRNVDLVNARVTGA